MLTLCLLIRPNIVIWTTGSRILILNEYYYRTTSDGSERSCTPENLCGLSWVSVLTRMSFSKLFSSLSKDSTILLREKSDERERNRPFQRSYRSFQGFDVKVNQGKLYQKLQTKRILRLLLTYLLLV